MVYFLCKAYDSDRQNCYFALSLPVRGAWVEICSASPRAAALSGRSPCGERGLKCGCRSDMQSWLPCRSPCGERGLKSPRLRPPLRQKRRSPCGERGLKYDKQIRIRTRAWSLPVRGAWVEIYKPVLLNQYRQGSLPVRGAWVEIRVRKAGSRGDGRRSPCGERGLKSAVPGDFRAGECCRSPCGERGLKSLRRGGVGGRVLASLPVRGAWVEMRFLALPARWNGGRSPCGERGLK